MRPVGLVELVIGMIAAILALHWAAARLRLPPSVALLIGGGALAFIPGVPALSPDPDMVLALFLPPLLADGAWNTAIIAFRRHFARILGLAIGAVAFTTLAVALAAHWAMPSLPWAACAALGAIVSPPDAVSARAVLSRVKLPRRLATLLEGESMLNDASGLVVFRFAVAAALGGGFRASHAAASFVLLAAGGVVVGFAIGVVWTRIVRRIREDDIVIAASCLICWVAYFAGDALGVSGVIATVTAGLMLGHGQHRVLRAATRLRGVSFWQVMIFLFEATVFILIGFSLRGVLLRVGGLDVVWDRMSGFVLAVVVAMTLARFVWVFGGEAAMWVPRALGLRCERPMSLAEGTVLSWAGMRGVVSLAVALSVPERMPGRDLMVVTAFAAIAVSVLVQGTTLGLMIRLTGLRPPPGDRAPLTLEQAQGVIAEVKRVAVADRAHDAEGTLIHPRLLEQYTRRAKVSANYVGNEAAHSPYRRAHYDVVLAANRAGREALLDLYRARQVDEEILTEMERDLDIEELAATAARSEG